jgi:hypothetical protein
MRKAVAEGRKREKEDESAAAVAGMFGLVV